MIHLSRINRRMANNCILKFSTERNKQFFCAKRLAKFYLLTSPFTTEWLVLILIILKLKLIFGGENNSGCVKCFSFRKTIYI